MRIEGTGIEDTVIDIKPLDYIMGSIAFVRAGQWDYDRVTYDYKIESAEKNITYYIRVQAIAEDGDVDRGDAIMRLRTPLLGKHYYPHGVEYGEQENFPDTLVERSKALLAKVSQELEAYINK